MTPVKAINHIGIAVRSIDAQRPFYEGTLGAVFEGVEDVPSQKVRVAFFRISDVTGPGSIRMTFTPVSAISSRSTSVIPSSACFVAT